MVGDDRKAGSPFFLDSAAGRVFAIYFAPEIDTGSHPGVLYLPPFAEEMNRSRRMATLQARALAACGCGVLLLDPYGTGDSEGDFRDARLSVWLADVASAANWLEGKGHSAIKLWGLRFGTLLARAAIEREPARFAEFLFWQPVTDGRTMLTQFLRIALAASLAKAGERVTTDSLRARLREGRSVEVAGYELAPELATDLDALTLTTLPSSTAARVQWFEVGPDASDQISLAGTKVIERWRENGATVSAQRIVGPQFWLTAEIKVVPALIDATAASFVTARL